MIREYIVNYISNKLKSVRALVVYDPEQFYVDLLPAFSKQMIVIDVRESVLTSREKAYDYFNNYLPKDDKASLLIYSPFSAPLDEQEKVNDPFFIFTQSKNYFPYSAGDRYEALCKSCFPSKEQQIGAIRRCLVYLPRIKSKKLVEQRICSTVSDFRVLLIQ